MKKSAAPTVRITRLPDPIRCIARDMDFAPVPADLVTRGGAVIGAVHGGRIAEYARGVVMVVASGIPLAPCRERFPAERHEDLLAPRSLARIEPAFIHAATVAVEAKSPMDR